MTIHWKTMTELGAAYRAGDLSPVEATDALLARIEQLDPTLHAYRRVDAESARATAAERERELTSGRDRGPLHGVPVALKDICTTADGPTSAGTAFLSDVLPREDAVIVERLREAGAILLGKLTMTEGAYGMHHPDVPVPVNPWNAERWSGVSSSGSGVSVASGLAFGAIGTDTGGSIRFPSAVNGITGIKPTWGRVPRHGIVPLAGSLDHVGPMTRSARDAGAMLGVLAGPDPRDPTAASRGVPDDLSRPGEGVKGLRIGFDERYATDGMSGEIVDLVREALRTLDAEGAEIRPVSLPPSDELVLSWGLVCAAEAALAHEAWFPARADDYGPAFRTFLESGRAVSGIDYARAHEARLGFTARLQAVFDDVDVLAMPTLGVPVPPANPPLDETPPEILAMLLRFTAPFDFSGNPTISLPAGFVSDGMPASLQLVGRPFDEATLVRAGDAFQGATSWHERHPDV